MKAVNILFIVALVISTFEFIAYCAGLYTPSGFAIGVDMFNTILLFTVFSFAKYGVTK